MKDDPEFVALGAVHAALKDLDPESQKRVIEYVASKLGLALMTGSEARNPDVGHDTYSNQVRSGTAAVDAADHDTDGISPIALKWMRRSGFTVHDLSQLFSLGTEEIDLVAKKLPAKSKNARTRNVILLKGIAAYLSSGAARISDEQIKEACIHYDAFDSPNHSKYIRGMSSELSGNKTNGFVLTARGITSATDLINDILGKTQS